MNFGIYQRAESRPINVIETRLARSSRPGLMASFETEPALTVRYHLLLDILTTCAMWRFTWLLQDDTHSLS